MSEGYFVDAKKVASGGYLHLLKAPFGAAAAIEHRPDVSFWSGIAADVTQVHIAFATVARRTMRISAMHLRHIVH